MKPFHGLVSSGGVSSVIFVFEGGPPLLEPSPSLVFSSDYCFVRDSDSTKKNQMSTKAKAVAASPSP